MTLAGSRVLIAEDDPTIAVLLGDVLENLGGQVVGPAATVSEARLLTETESIDLALLDVHLEGHPIYPVAELLASRGVPFAFLTGDVSDARPEPLRTAPTLAKPFTIEDLEQVILRLGTHS